jgi:uncharacterized repeat protein (TIGR01451 family)
MLGFRHLTFTSGISALIAMICNGDWTGGQATISKPKQPSLASDTLGYVTTTYRNECGARAFGRPTMIALWLLVLGSWVAIGAGSIGTASLANAALIKKIPSSQRSPKSSARPPAVPGLSISISDGRTSTARGDHLRYVVEVKNAGGATARNLLVTVTLPPYLSASSTSRRSTTKAGRVSWHTSLRPGRTASFTIAAVVGKTPRGMGHLAVVACADLHSGTPVVCAAHLDRLPGAAGVASSNSGTGSSSASPSSAGNGKTRDLVGGLIVIACILLAALVARRIRGRKGPAGHARA